MPAPSQYRAASSFVPSRAATSMALRAISRALRHCPANAAALALQPSVTYSSGFPFAQSSCCCMAAVSPSAHAI